MSVATEIRKEKGIFWTLPKAPRCHLSLMDRHYDSEPQAGFNLVDGACPQSDALSVFGAWESGF